METIFKTCDVVLTNALESVHLQSIVENIDTKKLHIANTEAFVNNVKMKVGSINFRNKVICITSDERIKFNDLYLDKNNEICVCRDVEKLEYQDKKVIATNNKDFLHNCLFIDFDFVCKYVEKYNSDNQIKQIKVKYIPYYNTDDVLFVKYPDKASYGFIDFQYVNDIFSREQVISLIHKYKNDLCISVCLSVTLEKQWFDKNL